ncbi:MULTISPECIES: tyrosine-type recombinase/integrase [unclassified Streptomyces]|uniref:tyrosine-type recombinase/integrase n=1 Tax=unclassified Streptomyces TaxID=2593676 RepID=UPI0036E4DB98
MSYTWFQTGFRNWITELDLGGHYVAHQARHTLATRLLRHGATPTHIRRYLGHVSDRMAEHYVYLTQSDLDNVLQHVWVAGPGTAHPGELLGLIRDLEAEWTEEAVQRIATENTPLKQRVRQLTADNRTLDERLKAARSNLRFQDRRVADLEAHITGT